MSESTLPAEAENAREQARNPDGTFGNQATHTEPGDVSLGTGGPSPAFDPAGTSFEAEGIEALLEDLNERLEWPEAQHYSDDDIADMKVRINEMEARLEHLRNPRPVTPQEKFAAATEAFHEAQVTSVEAAVDVMRDIVLTEHPDAAFLELTESDQDFTNGMWPGAVYDKDGNELGDLSDDGDLGDAGAWLPHDGDHWEYALAVPEERPASFVEPGLSGVTYMAMSDHVGGPR